MTTLRSVYRSLRTINRFEAFTLFSRVTLIRRLQSTSDLDHLHARELPCSSVKSRDDPISGRRGDSGVLYSFIYRDCGRDNTALTIVRLQHCIMDINHWMSASRLKLNMDKTELIWTGSTKYSVTARNA